MKKEFTKKDIVMFLTWRIYEPTIGKLFKSLKHTMVITPFGHIDINDLDFENDWTLLMFVVEKLEKLNYEVSIIDNECSIGDRQDGEHFKGLVEITADTKKKAVYKAVTKVLTGNYK